MAEYLGFMRFDVIFAIVAVVTIILSAFRNQRIVFRNFICLVLAVAIVFVPVAMDFSQIGTKIIGIIATKIIPYANQYINVAAIGTTAQFNKLLVVALLIVAAAIIYFILVAICALIGGSDKKKAKKKTDYATKHRPIWGIIVGILKAAVYCYVLFILFTYIKDFMALDFSKEIVYKAIQGFDPVLEKIKTVINGVMGA